MSSQAIGQRFRVSRGGCWQCLQDCRIHWAEVLTFFQMAYNIRGYLNVPKEIRHQVALCGAVDGSGTVDPEVALAFLRKQQALQKLGGVLGS